MARILGVEVPNKKRIIIGLTYIYGIGVKRAEMILNTTHIDPHKRVEELTTDELKHILEEINSHYKVEGDLRAEKMLAIKKLIDISCYVGRRHREGRPVRGQRTRNNGRTKKGPKKNAIKKKNRTR